MKTKSKVACSDWHLSWGLGTNKIGKLEKLDGNKYRWTGRAQGRHGQILMSRYTVEFLFVSENEEIVKCAGFEYNPLPQKSEVLKAIKLLNE